jgi:probable phosphoglycerate mutase
VPRILLVRHAESAWNTAGRWQGWADPPLSGEGRRQAARAARCLATALDIVVSSDLTRARQTAEILAGAVDLRPPRIDRELREYDLGDWSGLTRAEIERRWPGAVEPWDAGRLHEAPGGEAAEAFVERVKRALRRVADLTPDGTALIVSHGRVVLRVVQLLGGPVGTVGHLAGRAIDIDPGAGRWRLGPPVDLLGDR